MSYLVLARKWRPTRFADVVGQTHITRTLQNAIEQKRIPHALLFIGSRGVGKTSCARILAKALNCLTTSEATSNPCDQCDSCVSINQGTSVDVFEIDGASNNGVEQVREIRESARFIPTLSRKKIYIIDEVHMLSIAAFNALLKTLEEPPAHVGFIFATTEPHKIPDTIISRCQRFDFKRIADQDIVDALTRICQAESIQADRAALEHIAREARGGMRDSLSLLDQMISFCGTHVTEAETRRILGLTSRETLLHFLRALLQHDSGQILYLIDEQVQAGADLKRFMADFLKFLRDLMVIKVNPTPQKILNLPAADLSAMQVAAQAIEVPRVHRLFNTLMQGMDDMMKASAPRLAVEMSLLQMCHQGDASSIPQVLSALTHLEQHLIQHAPSNSVPITPHASQVSQSQSLALNHALTSLQTLQNNNVPSHNLPQHIAGEASTPSHPVHPSQVAPPTHIDESFNTQMTPVPLTSESPPPNTATPPIATTTHATNEIHPNTTSDDIPSSSHAPSSSVPNTSVSQVNHTPPFNQAQSHAGQTVPTTAIPSRSSNEAQSTEDNANTNDLSHSFDHSSHNISSNTSSNISDRTSDHTSNAYHSNDLSHTTHSTAPLPPHPALPFDVTLPQNRGINITDTHYQQFDALCQRISIFDRFFASKLRLHTRLLEWRPTSQLLVIAVPSEMEKVLQQQQSQVYEFVHQCFSPQTQIQIIHLENTAHQQQIETLADFIKRQAAHQAIREMHDALTDPYIQHCLQNVKGEVIYVQPASLSAS